MFVICICIYINIDKVERASERASFHNINAEKHLLIENNKRRFKLPEIDKQAHDYIQKSKRRRRRREEENKKRKKKKHQIQ